MSWFVATGILILAHRMIYLKDVKARTDLNDANAGFKASADKRSGEEDVPLDVPAVSDARMAGEGASLSPPLVSTVSIREPQTAV